MANHMKEVAKMLGVELGEEFEVDFQAPNYAVLKLMPYGLDVVKSNVSGPYPWGANLLTSLLSGTLAIKRKLWKPSYGEHYYSIGPGGVLEPGVWNNDFIDRMLYKLGNFYRTQQEAETDKDKWVAFYLSDDALEV